MIVWMEMGSERVGERRARLTEDRIITVKGLKEVPSRGRKGEDIVSS